MKYMQQAGLAAAGLLFFIWPVPHTITIRGILIAVSLAIFALIAFKCKKTFAGLRRIGLPFKVYILLTLWLIIEALLVSPETSWSLKEIAGQWGTGFASLAIGLLIGISSEKDGVLEQKNILTMLAIVLALHILYVDLRMIMLLLKDGQLPERMNAAGLTEGIDKSSYLSNYLLMILGAEVFFRTAYKRRSIAVGDLLLAVLLLMTLLSIYLESVRNGTIVAVVTAFILGALLIRERGHHIIKPLAALAITVVVFSFLSLGMGTDKRWQTFWETVPLAFDTQTNKAWLNGEKYPFPKLANGEAVDPSNYFRLAWLKEGSILLIEHPLGIGFGRNAFGHGIKNKYGEESRVAHSHSGLLDFSIGAGIPGVLLWIGFLFCLMRESFMEFKSHNSYAGLLLMLIVVTFGLRMVVDSIIRDHMLQQFMFLAGLLYMLMPGERSDQASLHGTERLRI